MDTNAPTSPDSRAYLTPDPKHARDQWYARHMAALTAPRPGFEAAIVAMFGALDTYACAHSRRYSSPLGEDYVLGDEWRDMARGLRGLLNGELGRLDAGTVDAAVLNLAAAHGVDMEGA